MGDTQPVAGMRIDWIDMTSIGFKLFVTIDDRKIGSHIELFKVINKKLL